MKKSTQMKKRVWCELPDALLERLLPLLPVPSLLRFRCVCKSWNSYILSSDFLHLCSSPSASAAPASCSNNGDLHRPESSSSYLLLSTWSSNYPLLAFNPSRQTWHLPSLDFLLKQRGLALAASTSGLSVVAAAGGLLCFSDGGSLLVVCNPVTKTMRQIECREQEGRGERMLTDVVMASMKYDEEERSYELMMVGTSEREEGGQVTCVYESKRHVWRREKQREALVFESSGVFMGGDFYVLTSLPMKLMVFSREAATWREHGAGLPAAGVQYPCLVESGGRLLLLAAVGDEEQDELSRYCVWRMEGLAWEEVARMPDAIFQQIGVKEYGFQGLSCVALQQGSIYMTSSEGCLILDTPALVWDWLPQSPILGGLFACIKDIYSMHPSLDNVT
ncbi:hypothetical protein L7F22_002207 [Adiantum nelumboides]|nr:hypothetical protein [Adiantum nelumboides]